MTEKKFGMRKYTTSEKTKRPQKGIIDYKKLEKRNANQKRLYITLDNINEIFSNNNDKWPVCYNMMFNLIQSKVTKYFNTRNYDRKKELSYDCINRLYSVLKRKLLQLKEQSPDKPVSLFFYISAFFRYIDLVVYSTIFYGTQDQKYTIQEPENFATEDVLQNQDFDYYQYEEESEVFSNRKNNELINHSLEEDSIKEYNKDLEKYLENPENTVEGFIADNSEKIKQCIENNQKLDSKEKSALFRLYRSCYSKYGLSALTKRDQDIIRILSLRADYEPDLLKDLKEILNGEGKSTED